MSKEKARNEAVEKQKQITAQWKGIASTYPQAYEDLLAYLDNLRNMYINCGEERSMTVSGINTPIDDHTIAALLQGARVCGIVSTYIKNRVDSDVAQPIKTK